MPDVAGRICNAWSPLSWSTAYQSSNILKLIRVSIAVDDDITTVGVIHDRLYEHWLDKRLRLNVNGLPIQSIHQIAFVHGLKKIDFHEIQLNGQMTLPPMIELRELYFRLSRGFRKFLYATHSEKSFESWTSSYHLTRRPGVNCLSAWKTCRENGLCWPITTCPWLNDAAVGMWVASTFRE